VIGRGEKCAVRVRDRAVSRRHARIVRQRSTDFLEAMPDTNGLFINGEPVREATLLRAGDVIELGHSLLRYDGPENALQVDEKAEPTVTVLADELVEAVELPPEPPEETPVVETPLGDAPVSGPPPVRPGAKRARRKSSDLVLVAAGAALVLIGLVVTISACV